MEVPQLSDFGISSITINPDLGNASTPFPSYTPRWAAPELLEAADAKSSRPTKMSDVYSFAMVVVEVEDNHHRRFRPTSDLITSARFSLGEFLSQTSQIYMSSSPW